MTEILCHGDGAANLNPNAFNLNPQKACVTEITLLAKVSKIID